MRAVGYFFSAVAGLSLALTVSSAQAALTISGKPTQNVTCNAGVCSATAKTAVLNVTDLATLIASSSVTVQSGGEAQDIVFDAPFSWASSNGLTLDAYRSLKIDKPVSDAGAGPLTLATNDGGSGGGLYFGGKGHIAFAELFNVLTINGAIYELIPSLVGLVAEIAENPSGNFALSTDFDAGPGGAYTASPIGTNFSGRFEGLGNTISNLKIRNTKNSGDGNFGLFAEIAPAGVVENLGIRNLNLLAAPISISGALAAVNEGTVSGDWASGSVGATPKGREAESNAGGLVGVNEGTITLSHAAVVVTDNTLGSDIGGLVSVNTGIVDRSYATGSVIGKTASNAGGLVGDDSQTGARHNGAPGKIMNSYSTGAVTGGGESRAGGLLGYLSNGRIAQSYATGYLKARRDSTVGGFVGDDESDRTSFKDCYWDTDTSGVSDPAQGAGNVQNDPGITGLTTGQLQSTLPAGFDSRVWAQNPKINNGYPYLIDNSPTK